MRRRFNLRFALCDPERFDAITDTNPFQAEQQVLCSLSLIAGNPDAARAVLEGQWDLLVVDEAHHLAWSERESSLEYDLIEALAQVTSGVLLLTATPEQLVDRHGTGRVLLRNTRASIQGFPERRLIAYPLPEPDSYRSQAAGAMEGLTPERTFGAGWTDVDPRVGWLIETLRGLRPAKVLLICAHARTVSVRTRGLCSTCVRHCTAAPGFTRPSFTRIMEIVERDRAAAYFACQENGTQVLLCSEIGSEGRNFQFAHQLVLFDLPLDPDLLEQRIGRLDRIGQTQVVTIHVPYLTGGPGEVVFRWYAEGLRAFEHCCPAASAVLAEQRSSLLGAMEGNGDLELLIAHTRSLTDRLNADLATGRDRLLELQSHRPGADLALVDQIEEIDSKREVADFLTRYWDAFGVEHEAGPGGSVAVRPGSQMLQKHFPGLPEEGLTATCERVNALSHEDRELLTWEHPMVREAMELLTASDRGTSGLILMKDQGFKRATLLVECLYIAECPAPPELQVKRFLPRPWRAC